MFGNRQREWEEASDPRLAEMFQTYREATPDPDPSPEFQPLMWRKIEARRKFGFNLRRLAQGIVTAAAAVSLAMGVFLSQNTNLLYSTSYVELLAADQSHDSVEANEIEVDLGAGERAR